MMISTLVEQIITLWVLLGKLGEEWSGYINMLSLLGFAMSGLLYLWKYVRPDDPEPPPPANKIEEIIAWLTRYRRGIFLSAVVLMMLYRLIFYAPVFMITSPRDGAGIVTPSGQITVRGKGAIPGSPISVYVYDGSRSYPQAEEVGIDTSGRWFVKNVVLRKENHNYEIWAESVVGGINLVTQNQPRVVRRAGSGSIMPIDRLMAVVAMCIVLGLLIIGAIVYRKTKGE